MSNGQRLDGRILEKTETTVRFEEQSRMVLNLRRDMIEEIIEKDNFLDAEDEGDRALAARDFAAALDAFERAIDLGGSENRITPKMNRAREALRTAELGEFADDWRQVERAIEAKRWGAVEDLVKELQSRAPEDHAIQPRLRDTLAQSRYARAQAMLDSINYSAAEKMFREVLDVDPAHFQAMRELARLNARSSRTAGEAANLYAQLLDRQKFELEPGIERQIRFEYGELLLGQGDFLGAATQFDTVYRQVPNFSHNLQNRLVDSLVRLARSRPGGDFDLSVKALRRALEIRPDDARLRFDLGDNLLLSRQYNEAIVEYTRLTERHPNYRRAHHQLALCYMGLSEIAPARRHLEQEVQNDAENYEAHVVLGEILLMMGDYDQAREYFIAARALDRFETRAVVALARTERILGNYPEARRYITEMLEIHPDDIGANLELGIIAKEEKKYEESNRVLDRTVRLIRESDNAHEPDMRRMMADTLLARGEVKLLTRGPATANEDFGQALTVFPNYAQAYFSIGTAYEKKFDQSDLLEDLRLAEENMLKARELAPENPQYAFGLGVLYHRVLASVDNENRLTHQRSAIKQYEEYLERGGMEISRVESWIRELGGGS